MDDSSGDPPLADPRRPRPAVSECHRTQVTDLVAHISDRGAPQKGPFRACALKGSGGFYGHGGSPLAGWVVHGYFMEDLVRIDDFGVIPLSETSIRWL